MMILSWLVINQLTVFQLANKYSNYIPNLSVLKSDKIEILLQWFGTIKEPQTCQFGNVFGSMIALPRLQNLN